MTQNRRRFCWARLFCIYCSAFVVLPGAVLAQTETTPLRLAPILVEADHFQIDLAAERAVWRGNVTATQGLSTFRAGSLTVNMEQLQRGSSQANSSADAATTANGYQLSAEKLTYDLDQGRIVGHGNCELRRGDEMIRAERIVYQVTEQTAVATPTAEGRVLVQFLSDPDNPLFPTSLAAPAAAD